MLSEAILLGKQIASAMDYAHQKGVLHRDIKPGNIMLKPEEAEGLPYRPIITDLGLAKLAEGGVITTDGSSMGTPAYMSPEQALGESLDARSDVYSLGILLYELCTGYLPFAAKTISGAIKYHSKETPPSPHTLRPDLPHNIEAIILKALQKDPEERFQDACLPLQML
jgi:serine/threonine protein kinase